MWFHSFWHWLSVHLWFGLLPDLIPFSILTLSIGMKPKVVCDVDNISLSMWDSNNNKYEDLSYSQGLRFRIHYGQWLLHKR